MSESIDWQVESLRITVFPMDIDGVTPSEHWDALIGLEPAEMNIQRGGVNERSVEYENGSIALIEHLDRIEWRYLFRSEEEEPRLPIIGSYAKESQMFLELAKQWLSSPFVFPIYRLGFGAVLLYPVETETQGYETLSRFLKSIDLNGVTDLVYRVNRRRHSQSISGLQVNRLATWNVASFNLVNIQLSPSNVQPTTTVLDRACRLELDINSSPAHTQTLPTDRVVDLLREFAELGDELSKHGDIA